MFKIIKRTNIWFIISGSLMALSIVAIAVFGLRLGIDYKGGTVIEFTSVNPNKVNVVDNI